MVASRLTLPKLPTRYCQLRYGATTEIHETGWGPPLVLVPGLAGGVGLLQPLIDSLSRHHRVITYQLRGESENCPQPPFPFERHAEDLSCILDELRLERPALFGLSFGAAVALEFAVQNPHRISWLGVQGAGPAHHSSFVTQVFQKVLQRLRLPTDSHFVNQFFSILWGDEAPAGEEFDQIVQRLWHTDQTTMAIRMEQLAGYDVSQRLHRLRVPTLVLGGEQDMITPVTAVRELASLIPDAELETIPQAGHLASITHTKQIVASILRFKKSLQFA